MRAMGSLKRAVVAWREQHGGRRGPLPVELRREAGLLAGELGDEVVADALDLKRPRVRQWRAKYRLPGARPAGARFVELSSTVAPGSNGIVVEVSRAGRVVRIQGALDPGALASIISAAFAEAEA